MHRRLMQVTDHMAGTEHNAVISSIEILGRNKFTD